MTMTEPVILNLNLNSLSIFLTQTCTSLHFGLMNCHRSCSALMSHMPKRNLSAPHCQTHSQQLVLCIVLSFASAVLYCRTEEDG